MLDVWGGDRGKTWRAMLHSDWGQLLWACNSSSPAHSHLSLSLSFPFSFSLFIFLPSSRHTHHAFPPGAISRSLFLSLFLFLSPSQKRKHAFPSKTHAKHDPRVNCNAVRQKKNNGLKENPAHTLEHKWLSRNNRKNMKSCNPPLHTWMQKVAWGTNKRKTPPRVNCNAVRQENDELKENPVWKKTRKRTHI